MSELQLSVVVPVYNEEENIKPLTEEVVGVLDKTSISYEIVFADDGSTDNTLNEIKAMRNTFGEKVRFVSFDKNKGQTAAFIAGFRNSKGKYIATLDGDMQNDPADLPSLFNEIEKGEFDMVNGIRAKRQDNFIRKISSKIGNGFRNWLTNESVSDVGCSIRIFKAECVKEIPVFNGLHRFFPTLVRMQGYTITEIPVNHRERERGTSKYGVLNRAFVGFADTFAVRWMQKRVRIIKYKETSEDRK